MTDGPQWFAAKRYGIGAGFPIRWQGWLLLLLYMGAIFGAAYAFRDQPAVVAAIAIPLSLVFALIVARTTRGGWRWRWGSRD